MNIYLFLTLFLFPFLIFSQEVRLLHTKVSQANWGEPIKLEANITNAHLVNYIIVNYKTDLDQHYSQIEMNPAEGKFIAEIPPLQENYTNISYYVEIFDLNEKVISGFASKKEPQIIKIRKEINTDNKSITISGKDKSIEFKTTNADFEVYISELQSLYNVEVISASKTAQKSTDAPATIHVITKDVIKRRGYDNLMELLEDIPEIEMQKKSNAETSNIVTFRGIMGNAKFLILLNGFRINSPTGTPHAITTNYPLINVKRVEVILGPASALYGVDAFSGIVNIITEDGDEINGLKSKASYGMYNTTDNYLATGLKQDDFEISLIGHFYQSDEPNLADAYKNEYDGYDFYFDNYKTTGAVVDFGNPNKTIDIYDYYQASSSYFLNGTVKYKNFEAGFTRHKESHITSGGMRPEYYPYMKNNIYEMIVQSIYGKNSYLSSNGKWGAETSLWFGSYQLDPNSQFYNTFTSFTENQGYKYAEGNVFKIEEQLNININKDMSVILGASYDMINDFPKTGDLPHKYDPNIPGDDQDMYYMGTQIPLNGEAKVMQDFYNINYQNLGSYAQFQGNFFENKILTTIGSRFDYNTRYGESLNPRAGLVVHPIPEITIKLLYGKAFLAPSSYEAYQHYGSFTPVDADENFSIDNFDHYIGYFWHLPNKKLEPEKLQTLEGGFSYLTKDIIFQLNGFYTKVDNLVLYTTQLNLDHNDSLMFKGQIVEAAQRPKNSGSANIYGGTAKIEAIYKFSGILLNPYFAYSYIDGEIQGVERGDETVNINLTYTAKHTLKAGIDFEWKGFTLSTKVLYKTESYHQDLVYNENGSITTGKDLPQVSNDSYFVLQAYLSYLLFSNKSMDLTIYSKLTNILNAKYYNVSVGGTESFDKTPQDPFKAVGGLVFNYKY